ncbi:MAG: hypothetical protein RBT80_15830 [Candidatus Vecturithrix sp.]|jgi:hypothetical protein|nr:hypothetical protein [Candidatus Vecturithrix sp.]
MNYSFHIFWFLVKVQRWLFGLIWRLFLLLYFVIGLGALAVLFLIEAQFFMQVTQHVILGYGIAAIFEITKVGTSIIKQALLIANKVCRIKVSSLIQSVTAMLQLVLIVVTLFCSVVVVSAYLEGTTLQEYSARSSKSRKTASLQPAIASTLNMLEDGLNVTVKQSAFISVFALLVSALFQGTVYVVFGHVIATQASEIEHIFEVKMQRIDAKKNFTLNV